MATASARSSRTLALSHGDSPPAEWTTRTLHTRACASLWRSDARDDEPAAHSATRPTGPPIGGSKSKARLTRYGGDCYAYCALAAGFIDLVIETNIKPHDIVALIADHRGRGRRGDDLGRRRAAKGGRILAAGDQAVHEEARRLLLEG